MLLKPAGSFYNNNNARENNKYYLIWEDSLGVQLPRKHLHAEHIHIYGIPS